MEVTLAQKTVELQVLEGRGRQGHFCGAVDGEGRVGVEGEARQQVFEFVLSDESSLCCVEESKRKFVLVIQQHLLELLTFL